MSQVTELFNKPLIDLLFEAQQIHRQHFDPRQVQVSTLLSIKTGACPEDCKYCPQSARYKTGLESERLMEVEQVLESARQAKNAGSTRFCMGAAWKNPNDRDMPYLEQMVKGVKALGLESCMTLGTLTDSQAQRLAGRGSITTTTTSIPRRNFTATSSPPVPIRSAWIRWIKCAMPGSKSAPAASSGWERP
jgi:biotin synthase